MIPSFTGFPGGQLSTPVVNVTGRACSNTLHVKREVVEDRLLAGIRESLSRPDVVAEIERQVRKELLQAVAEDKHDIEVRGYH